MLSVLQDHHAESMPRDNLSRAFQEGGPFCLIEARSTRDLIREGTHPAFLRQTKVIKAAFLIGHEFTE